jgi:N-acetylmuramoyl-L-alanine amidase
MQIIQDFLTKDRNRPALRDPEGYAIRAIRGIIAHWTANTNRGADARAHQRYFNNVTNRFASAHYVVDDKVTIQCLPDNEVGFHVGDNSDNNRPDGIRLRGNSGLTANYFVIGFEMCVNSDGDWNTTYRNSVELAAQLLRKYQFTVSDLYRHHDITGKDCPKMMIEDAPWQAFKRAVEQAMLNDPAPPFAQGSVTSPELNVRAGGGPGFPVLERLRQGTLVHLFEEINGWYRIGTGKWVSKNFIQIVHQTWLGRINSRTGANVRSGAGSNFPVMDSLPNTALVHIIGVKDDWMMVGSGRWVHKNLIERVNVRFGTVTGTEDLNIRVGPGTDFRITRRIPKGARVRILDEQDGWYRLSVSEWVFGKFIGLL